jgi:CRISPR/Cas system-associated endonuclease Cas1
MRKNERTKEPEQTRLTEYQAKIRNYFRAKDIILKNLEIIPVTQRRRDAGKEDNINAFVSAFV